MLGILYGIIIICLVVIGILWMRLRLYKGQIHRMKEELSMLHKEDTNTGYPLIAVSERQKK